ncbi:hypothetical protein NDU88_006248 [Pleurodeles waltl]|uniref:Uncharacterized protein n=1 Tax=Pleurodeles waltl TaxID=8319 RepID=A0AAV7MBP2_PLEWA|nr:hypothetical protein NDU88_006248 [Pleurodeles waltl]
MNRQVQDTIPHVQEPSQLYDRVREALSNRENRNDKMSRKRRAKKRDIHVGDHVLVRNRRGGSKFMMPFKWVLSAIKGTMVTAKRKQETITQNISFFKVFRMADGIREMEQNSPLARSFEDGDGGSVGQNDNSSLLPSPGGVVDNPLSVDQGGADVLNSEFTQGSDQGLPDSLPFSSHLPGKEECCVRHGPAHDAHNMREMMLISPVISGKVMCPVTRTGINKKAQGASLMASNELSVSVYSLPCVLQNIFVV